MDFTNYPEPETIKEICVDFLQPKNRHDNNEIYRFVGEYAADLNGISISYRKHGGSRRDEKWYDNLNYNVRVDDRLICFYFGTLSLSPEQLLLFAVIGINFRMEGDIILIMYENVKEHPAHYYVYNSRIEARPGKGTLAISDKISIEQSFVELAKIFPPGRVAAIRRKYFLVKERLDIEDLYESLIPYGESNNLSHLMLKRILEEGEVQEWREKDY